MTTIEPTFRRKFQYTDLVNNNNKFWEVKWFAQTGEMVVTFGRVGAKGQTRSKIMSQSQVLNEIRSKLAKGYTEVELHTVKALVGASKQWNATVVSVVEDMLKAAGQHIQTYLNTTVEALSLKAIEKGRQILNVLTIAHKNGAPYATLLKHTQDYYTTIPTKLAAKINPSAVVNELIATLSDNFDRLAQLEAAVSQVQVQPNGAVWSALDGLASQLELLDPTTNEWLQLAAGINSTMVHGYRVRVKNILKVTIEDERKKYEANPYGKYNTKLLYHGSGAQNFVHILKGGLKIMPSVANGSMFGRGLYFACQASKSTNYCSKAPSGNGYLLVAEVALGKQYVAPDGYNYTKAPEGYHSVWGKQGQTGSWSGKLQNHEYIVYHENQATIRYLVQFEKI